MKKLDPTEFMQEVLERLNDVPESFKRRLLELVMSSPTTRSGKIRDLIDETTHG